MCGKTFNQRNGIISTGNYPIYETNLNCNTVIQGTDNNSIIKAYMLEMSINEYV